MQTTLTEQRLSRGQLQRLGISRKRLNGARGLVVAVISVATVDYLAGDSAECRDAAAFLCEPEYRRHLARSCARVDSNRDAHLPLAATAVSAAGKDFARPAPGSE